MVGGKSLVPFGFTVLTLPPDAVRRLGGKAVYVNYVEPLSPAEEAGLQANTDVVFMVDGKTVSNAEEFDRALQDARGDSIRLAVQRGMQRGYVDVPRRK